MMVCLYCTRAAWEGFSLLQQQPNTSLAALPSVGIVLRTTKKLNPLSWRVTSNGIIGYWAPSPCQRCQGIRAPSTLFTQCRGYCISIFRIYILEPMLLLLPLPGLNKPTNSSDLAENFYKGRQMSKNCWLQALQLPLRELGGGGCAKEASPLPYSLCWRMPCALQMMQLGMQTHLGQPGDVGFIKFCC